MTNTNSPSTYGEYSDQKTDELDEYGVWVKSAPQLLDESETPVLSEGGKPLQGLPELSDKIGPATSEDSGFPADLLKNFLTDIEDIEDVDETPVSTINETGQKAETETLDVPSIFPALFSETIETTAAIPMDSELVNTEKAAVMESQNVHADLLGRIADELVSIHDELTGIRQELCRSAAALMPELPKSDDLALIRSELNSIQEELRRKDELALIHNELTGIRQELCQTIAKPDLEVGDDDKQIILTRDEFSSISSIFNTMLQPHHDSEDSSEESPDYSPAEETSPELSLISEISLDKTPPDLGDGYVHIIEDTDPNDIKKLFAEGIKPLTPAPEDTSYLDMPPFDAPDLPNALTTTGTERSDEPLDEPLIDGLLIDNDSTKDLSIELDTERLHAAYYGEDEDDELLELEEYEDDENVADQDIGRLLMAENWEDIVDETSPDEPRSNEPTPETGPKEEPEKGSVDLSETPVSSPKEEPEKGSVDLSKTPVSSPKEESEKGSVDLSETPVSSPKEEPEKGSVDLSETPVSSPKESCDDVTDYLTHKLKRILTYMDQVLYSLPDDKVEAFTQSEHFTTYKQIFKTLGIS